MALLDFIQSPGIAAAASLLSPTLNSRTGPALQNAIANSLAVQRAQLRQRLLRQEILRSQQLQAAADRQRAAIGTVNPASFTAASVQRFSQTRNFADLVAIPKAPLVSIQNMQPLSASDLLKFRNTQGDPPAIGSTLTDLQAGGFKLQSTAEQNLATSSKGALAFIDRLEAIAFNKESPIFQEFSGISGRGKQGISNARDIAGQTGNPNLILYNDLSKAGLSIIVRALGEKGTLNDQDIERIRNALPKVTPLPDSPTIAREKMKNLRAIINEVSGRKKGSGMRTKIVGSTVFMEVAPGDWRPVIEE